MAFTDISHIFLASQEAHVSPGADRGWLWVEGVGVLAALV